MTKETSDKRNAAGEVSLYFFLFTVKRQWGHIKNVLSYKRLSGEAIVLIKCHRPMKGLYMGRNEPLISLIIPVYNVSNYLRQCLDSVVNQTYRNLEILIIDDGSTDGSGDMCDAYSEKDDRITVFHTENHGLSAARNYGLDHVSDASKYIAFLDSDDWMEIRAIQLLYETAYSVKADMVCCQYCNEYIGKSRYSYDLKYKLLLEGDQIIQSFACEKYIGNVAWNKLYRKELFISTRYPENRIFEDVATTYKIVLMTNRIVVIPERLIHYRVRDNSLSQLHKTNSMTDQWRSYHEKYVFLSSVTLDKQSNQHLLGDCIYVISRMWRWYYGCPYSERAAADSILDEMQAFIAEHHDEVIRDCCYSKHQKLMCRLALSRNPIMMYGLFTVTRLYRLLFHEKQYE